MKRILFVLATVFSLGVFNANADNDKIITKEMLPVDAQSFINTYFGELKISYAKLERDLFENSYEVVFTDGAKLEFNRKGEWEDVDCRYGEVPAAIIPVKIAEYVKARYPDAKIIRIERDRYGYEVKLSNRLELTFNKNFRIVDIDN